MKNSETDQKTIRSVLPNLDLQLDLVGPGVDDDTRRAIHRYGADAVQQAVKKLTKKPPRG